MDHHAVAAELFAAPRIIVTAWRDPVVEAHGWPAGDDRTLAFLCPILGPSATLMLHRLGGRAAVEDSTWAPEVLAATFGLGGGTAKHSPGARTLARLAQFDFALLHGPSATVAVRTHVGPLPARMVRRLPAYLAAAASGARTSS